MVKDSLYLGQRILKSEPIPLSWLPYSSLIKQDLSQGRDSLPDSALPTT